jgi:GNAT superfamily N-acetyltransferase
MSSKISAITPAEVPGLLEMIRELARFEKLEHEVKATVELLQHALFGPQPGAGALVARVDGELAGYALYFFTFSTFVGRAGIWLDDLFVRPQFRKQGLGRALIESVGRVGAERNCGRFEWTALNWNKPALDFYNKLGARVMDEWVMLLMDEEGLRRIAKV